MIISKKPAVSSDQKELRHKRAMRRLCHQLASLFLGLATLCAWSPRSALAQVTNEVVLVLGINENGHHSAQLTRHLERQLERASYKVRPSEGLTAAQRALRDQHRLIKLAGETKSRLLIWGEVQPTSDHKQTISLQLFDSANPANGGLDDFLVCRQEQLEGALPELADRLFGTFQQAKGKPVAVVVPPNLVKATTHSRDGLYRATPRWRKALGISLGGLAAAALGGAITLNLIQGRAVTGALCHSGENTNTACLYNNTALFATGYGVAGALVVGTWITLALPQ